MKVNYKWESSDVENEGENWSRGYNYSIIFIVCNFNEFIFRSEQRDVIQDISYRFVNLWDVAH